MKPIKPFIISVFFLVFILLSTTLFKVTQGESGIVLRLGQIVGEGGPLGAKIYRPGLHFKWPFIEQKILFDTRLKTLDITSSRIVTREKKDVIVDYFVKWRIENLGKYFRSTSGNQQRAETLLQQQLNTSLRAEFGKRTISELVTGERDDVMIALRQSAVKKAQTLGVSVIDVRIKGIELPENTSNAIYQRMRADMQKIANRHRADGESKAEAIKAEADAKVTVIIAQAKSDGQQLKAQGDSIASKIYALAYDKDPSFFAFYKSLKAYEKSFNQKNDILILDGSSAFFDYFKQDLGSKRESIKH